LRLMRPKVEFSEKNFLDRKEFSESLKIEKARILYDEYFIIMD